MVLLLPLSIVSFYLTVQLTALAMGIAVLGAMVICIVLLPASLYQGMSRRPNPRTYALVTAAWVGLIVLRRRHPRLAGGPARGVGPGPGERPGASVAR
jgi:hypothetical protein